MIKKDNHKAIFFGWFILAGSVLILSYQSVTFIYGLTAFMTPIALSHGWTYAQISLGPTIRGLEVGALDPVAGMVIDRYPARRLMILGTLVYTGGVVLLSQATNLGMFYSGFLLMGLGGAFCFSMLPQTVLARWFKRNIGKASGILATGYSIGGMFVWAIVSGIEAFGWQDLMLYLAFGGLIIGLPVALLYRNRPEDYGLLPDGDITAPGEKRPADDSVTTLRQVIRMRAFWLIGLACMMQMTAVHAITVHIVPYFNSLGIEDATASVSILIFSSIGLAIRLGYGYLADILAKKNVFAFSNALTTVALVILGLLNSDSFVNMVIFSVVYAFGVAGSSAMRVPITRDYFGAKSFGKIFGWLALFTVAGSVVGAPLAGWVYDTHGDYTPIWYVFAGLTALATVLLLLLPSRVSDSSNPLISGKMSA